MVAAGHSDDESGWHIVMTAPICLVVLRVVSRKDP